MPQRGAGQRPAKKKWAFIGLFEWFLSDKTGRALPGAAVRESGAAQITNQLSRIRITIITAFTRR